MILSSLFQFVYNFIAGKKRTLVLYYRLFSGDVRLESFYLSLAIVETFRDKIKGWISGNRVQVAR